jgi:hypothetical protein
MCFDLNGQFQALYSHTNDLVNGYNGYNIEFALALDWPLK